MVLAEMLHEEATKAGLNIGMDQDHMPDRAWMIIALATLNKDHEIFGKSYLPKVIQRGLGVRELEISNEDGFFTGLPKMFKLSDLKARGGACFSKDEKLQIKMQ